jgi:hypothetical protein
MAVLAEGGVVMLDIPTATDGLQVTVEGDAARYVGEQFTIGLRGGYLTFAGIRVVALPNSVD